MKLLSSVAARLIPTCLVAGLLATLPAILLSPQAAAQGAGAVVESLPANTGQAAAAGPVSPNNDALQLLLDQNRQLQAEVQALRGMVEEQGFEIRKLQRDSLSRYTDTDERLRNLEAGSVVASSSTSASDITSLPADVNNSSDLDNSSDVDDSSSADTSPSNSSTIIESPAASISPEPASTRPVATLSSRTTPSNRGTLQPAVLSEQQLYQMAYDSVINSNFEQSIAEFDQYLSIYPEGRFVTNGHYWKGQAYLYLNLYEEARDAYEIILNQYPDSAKLPDAIYGLALAYQGLGNVPQARQLLNDIKRRFPNTGVANLADTRLLGLD